MSKSVFECTMCGACCKGKGGIVVSPSDLLRLAAFLQRSAEEVVADYCEQNAGKLKIRTASDDYCIFFTEGKGCRVHDGKPSVCQAWPFFRGNLIDSVSFALAKDYCPGIAKDVSHEEFVAEARNYLSAHKLLAHDSKTEANALILD